MRRVPSQQDIDTVVLTGGVAANKGLRQYTRDLAARSGIRTVVPPFKSCTDNAAMIAFAGAQQLLAGENDLDTLTVNPRTLLPRVTRKGKGRRAA